MTELCFATRASLLARQQTSSILAALKAAHPKIICREVLIQTRGDRELSRALPEIGGKGVFTEELEQEIRAGRVDAAVHSLKDLPVEDAPGLIIGAIPTRLDPRDVIVSHGGFTLAGLPKGARVGTSSPRRAAQLQAFRPDLQVENLRGNIDTRLQKAAAGVYDAIVLAAAGLLRLGRQDAITEWLPLEVMLPAPGQGALAVQCRAADAQIQKLLAAIDDSAARTCVTAERAFLAEMGSGCALPLAAYAELLEPDLIHLHTLIASTDGHRVLKFEGQGESPDSLGRDLARQALAQGARKLWMG